MNALKNLGLNVVKANVFLDSSGKHNTFSITKADTGRKVEEPELLEAIRLTIINNLLQYHPESSAQLAMGVAFGAVPPPVQVDIDIATHISGLLAKAKFHVSYRGKAIIKPLQQVLANSLRYFLRRPSTEEASF
ncbi:hypothetical protein CRG98_039374 [Punica granatum]|uniref:Uncharacterized protein n=1 Tax=Punica granatum TaxID=22663 RepID=A0A2I0IA64_PUNGR|nr:hypothetical protein CRG98_039374 [Punica granatum]